MRFVFSTLEKICWANSKLLNTIIFNLRFKRDMAIQRFTRNYGSDNAQLWDARKISIEKCIPVDARKISNEKCIPVD